MVEIAQFILGMVGVALLFQWIDRDRQDSSEYPQDYMG